MPGGVTSPVVGALTGRVLNGEPRPIPNMEVRAIHEATAFTIGTMTDAQGNCSVALPARPGPRRTEAIMRVSEGGDLLDVPTEPKTSRRLPRPGGPLGTSCI
ncbi:hypothetical protein GCM10008949_28410 [Deinococcus humi]|nr:hypothetical protein GCM10008949_28410 [Deinococcus humi]